jgi:hypothetical protein
MIRMTQSYLSDYIILIFAFAAWFIYIVDVVFIHDFEEMYATMLIIASVFTISDFVILLIFQRC